MSYMTEKTAKELFAEYLKAEMLSDPKRTKAIALEEQLNKGGWYITSSNEGLTVKRKDGNFTVPKVDDYLLPKESKIQPYQGGTQTSYRPVLITVGIIAGILALTVLVVYIVKKHKANVKQNIKPIATAT